MSKIKDLDISNYIDNEYKEYSLYTINSRAIPSLVDGFKPVQRKIMYAAQKECPTSFVKVSTLAGALPKVAAYHHGAGEGAIVKMAQTFNNNAPLLDQDGAFGSSVVPVAGAPRYIYVKAHKNFHKIYLDNEITPRSLDLEDNPEPIYYLPIIPMVLVNGVDGIAVGFATRILSRNPIDITKACIRYLEKGKVPDILPFLSEYDVDWVRDDINPNKYLCKGKLRVRDSSTLEILSLPPDNDQEKYTSLLMTKVTSGAIKDFVDDSDKHFKFNIMYKRGEFDLKNDIDLSSYEKELKTTSSFTENITVISEHNTLREYASVEQLIKDFVEIRLSYYDKRISHNIDKHTKQSLLLQDKIEFIEEVVKKEFDPFVSTKKQIITHVSSKYKNSNPESLASIPVYNFTKDEVVRFKKELSEIKKVIKEWEVAIPKELYIADLKELLKTIGK